MGVPSFYRWLVGKYPKSVVRAVDSEDSDSTNPNPNGEFDNLYLDLNGVVHPCFHPDDESFGPTTLNEVFLAIFDYIDHLFRIVRPRKLLFMAVDGVAPRAKLNQQRARRYRTAKDTEIAEMEENRLRKEFERAGKELLPKQEFFEVADSNVITPGTIFMQKLSTALEYYIRLRLNNDPSWKSILVILSDANVPGEGEHKIVQFIRLQRSLPGYDPITRHCLYGLDADLIMLALATHEINFSILREDVLKQTEINISTLVNFSQKEQDMFKTRQWFQDIETNKHRRAHKKPYQFLNIWTFREYLELDMKPECQSVVDIERIVDDFIFICFFSGNDFLPHLPSIEIHEGGIDLLIAVYKKMFKSMGGYLVDTSRINERNTTYINFQSVKVFISEIGSYEEKIFIKRYTLRKKKLEKLLQEQENEEKAQIDFCNPEFSSMQQNFNPLTGASAHIFDSFSEKCIISSQGTVEASCSIRPDDAFENTKELKRILRQFVRDKSDLFKKTVVDNDKVKLGCLGWKARYYREKFSAENAEEVECKRIALVQNYVEGFCWVLKYYFTGVCSWSWYYPFYYGPFASDFRDLCFTEVSFTSGKPFEAFDQLMAVLPPRSSHALPKAYRSLMENDDSPIHNFYPIDFMVDNDGKRFAWQGVCKLPFIEEVLLLEATKNLHNELQDDELERNFIRNAKGFMVESNSLFTQICLQPRVSEDDPRKTQIHEVCGPRCGINCFLTLYEENSTTSNFTSPILGMEDISSDRSRCATFFSQEPQKHIPRLLTVESLPEKTIRDSDIVQKMLWHEYPGHTPPHSIQPQRFVPQTLHTRENWEGTGHGKPSLSSTSYDNGRGRGMHSPIVANWGRGRGIERPSLNNFEYHVPRRGQFGCTSSISASTLYDRGRGSGTRPQMVANWGRGVGAPSSNYHEYRGRGLDTPGLFNYRGHGRGRGTQPANYYGGQGRGQEGHRNSVWVPRKSEH